MTLDNQSTRTGAIARADAYFTSGAFERDLARRVAMPTESQNRPARMPDLQRYLTDEMTASFASLGFKSRIFENPVAGQGPILLAERIEGAHLPTVLGYGHGDVIRGQDAQWTKGAGPWVLARDGDRLYGRGTADNKAQHTINMAALAAVMAERAGRLGFNAKYIIEMAEETGSAGLAEVVAANKEAFSATVLVASDGPRVTAERPTLVLGNRGGLTFDLVCQLREGGHHSGNWGGLIADPAIRLAHAIAALTTATGAINLPELRPPAISGPVRAALADVVIEGGADAPAIDAWWGEPGLTPAEKVFGWNSFCVLAMVAGDPQAPVNAIAPVARARCQLRFVVGTDASAVVPAVRKHLAALGLDDITVEETPNVGRFPATRTEPDHPWAAWAKRSLQRSSNRAPAIVPSTGGGVPNDVFQDILGLPTLWLPHSYAGCQQHAPDEHVLIPVVRSALGLMAGLYWDLGEPGLPK